MTLRDARKAAKLTQAQLAAESLRLAEDSGVSQQLISRIERGDVRDPSHRAVMALSRALRLDPAAIDEFSDGGRR